MEPKRNDHLTVSPSRSSSNLTSSSRDYEVDPEHIHKYSTDDFNEPQSIYAQSLEDNALGKSQSGATSNNPRYRSANRLSRVSSNVTDISRIITNTINDELEQDRQERELEKSQRKPDAEQVFTSLSENTQLKNDGSAPSHSSTLDSGEKEEREESEEDLPLQDNGYAFLQAFMAMVCAFSTWGSNSAFGVFLQHAKTNDLTSNSTFPRASEMDYALIGSLVVCLAQVLAPIICVLYNLFGHYVLLIVGIVLQTSGYLLASFATQVWQLYLTQGVLIGISFSVVFIPSTLILPTWFDRQKSTAMGICVAGAGLGGVVFSLSLNKVIERTGDQRWALRLLAIVDFCLTTLALFILKPRRSRQQWKRNPSGINCSREALVKSVKIICDPKVFYSYPLCILAVWFGITILGYMLMLYTLASYGRSVGLSFTQASNITAILNAAQTVGRPILGLNADKLGRNNLAGSCCLIIVILLFAFWMNATSYASLIVFSIILGLFVGVGSTMCQSMAADMISSPDKLPAAWSGCNIVVGLFSMVGEVIALSLKDESISRPFLHTQIFAGCCFVLSWLLLLINREWLVRRLLRKRICSTLEILKGKDTTMDELDKLELRLRRYEHLVRPNIGTFIIRMFYPVRV